MKQMKVLPRIQAHVETALAILMKSQERLHMEKKEEQKNAFRGDDAFGSMTEASKILRDLRVAVAAVEEAYYDVTMVYG
jgi:hypothetical protein